MVSSSELTDKIVEKAKSFGASLAGVAAVASVKNSPSHTIYPKIGMNLDKAYTGAQDSTSIVDVTWPEDAVSVVVIGVEHNEDKPELDYWDGKGTVGNRILIKINNQLSAWIERTFPVKTYKLPYAVEKGGIFLKDAAVTAGLGCIGKNNLVVTPEYGPRIRFRSLLLNKKAKPTELHGFNPCKNCKQPCRKACPVKAYENTVYSAKTLAQSILPGIDGTYDRVSCNIKMEKDMDKAAMVLSSNQKEQHEIRQLIAEYEKSHIKAPSSDQKIDYCVTYCRNCELSCPVGMR